MRSVRLVAIGLGGCAAVACSGGGDSSERPEPFVREILAAESAAHEAQRSVTDGLLRAVADGGRERARDHLAPGFRGELLPPEDWREVPDATLSIRTYTRESGRAQAADGFLDDLFAHVAGWRTTLRRGFELDRFYLAQDGSRASGRGELRLAGEDVDGARVDLRAVCDVQFVAGENGFLPSRITVTEGTRVSARTPPFADVTGAVGLRYDDSAENRQLLQVFIDRHVTLALGGLSAVDWNRDGFWDLLGTRKGQMSALFLNDGRGGFVREATPVRSPLESGSFLLFVDLDNDGLEELVSSRVIAYEGDRARLGLYTRRDGEWELVEDALEFTNPVGRRRITTQTIVPMDFDGDGLLDLFFGVYGDDRSRGADYNTVEAFDGADNYLFMNRGGLHFEEESEARGLHGTQYTYVALAFDFDGDGDADLFEGNDFGANVLWENDGRGSFSPGGPRIFGGVPAYSMGLTLADYDNTGEWSLYVANMSSEAGSRIARIAEGLGDASRAKVATIASGNMLYTGGADSGRGAWREHAREAHVALGEWAWGSVFFDLENDGDKDLFVTNGFASHSDRALPDWCRYYWRQVTADAGFLERGERTRDVNAGLPFAGSFSGYQRDRLFYNPDGLSARFFEAAFLFGLDADHDGRCAVPVDVDGDGDLDLVSWTLQGLRLFENRSPRRHFARVRLVATRTQHHALGARVELSAGGVTQRDYVKRVEGFQTQVPADLHFGLGTTRLIERLTVEWPSGEVEEWSNLPVDRRLVVREGAAACAFETVPRWPEAMRPRPLADPARLARLVALPRESGVRATVLRFALSGETRETEWPDAVLTSEFADEVRFMRASSTNEPDAEGLHAAALGAGGAPVLPTTLILDRDGELIRAFRREPTPHEVAAALRPLRDEAPFPELLLMEGRRALEEARFRDALRAFERALAGDPKLAAACDGLGRAHVALGRMDLAEADYARSVAIDPDYALGHYNLGVTRTQSGRPAEALAPLAEALRITGEKPRMLLALGEAAALAERGDLALDAFRRAIRADPGSAPAHTLLGKTLAQAKRFGDAKASFEEALRLDPDNSEARRALRLVERLVEGD